MERSTNKSRRRKTSKYKKKEKNFLANWKSLDTRELPIWYDKAKMGVFIHWGIYSVPAFAIPPSSCSEGGRETGISNGSEWYWYRVKKPKADGGASREYHNKKYGKSFNYKMFVDSFTADNWDPNEWVELFYNSGARYIVLTAKHHDGFCMWDTSSSPSSSSSSSSVKGEKMSSNDYGKDKEDSSSFHYWDAAHQGPKRDVIKELRDAVNAFNERKRLNSIDKRVEIKKEKEKEREEEEEEEEEEEDDLLHFGLYFSLLEWFHPKYIEDTNQKNRRNTSLQFVNDVMMPQLKDIVIKYHPDILWADGDWQREDTYWHSCEFLQWLFNESPVKETVCVNDRWGKGLVGKHGSFYNYRDRHIANKVLKHKWECCLTISTSWGYNSRQRNNHFKSSEELVHLLVQSVACGGNFLLNVGPKADGSLVHQEKSKLNDLASWMSVNAEGIRATIPIFPQPTINTKSLSTKRTSSSSSPYSGVWFTQKQSSSSSSLDLNRVYMFLFQWPSTSVNVNLPKPKEVKQVVLLNKGTPKYIPITFKQSDTYIVLDLHTVFTSSSSPPTIRHIKCWCIRFSYS